jgi:hypothetical protein
VPTHSPYRAHLSIVWEEVLNGDGSLVIKIKTGRVPS